MQLQINGQAQTLTLQDQPTVHDVLVCLDVPTVRGVAVALNDQVVPRSQWSQTPVHSHDRLEIIQATQGG